MKIFFTAAMASGDVELPPGVELVFRTFVGFGGGELADYEYTFQGRKIRIGDTIEIEEES